MKNVTAKAKQAALRSRCKDCRYPYKCSDEMLKACFNSFVDGYKKGVKAAEKQFKKVK